MQLGEDSSSLLRVKSLCVSQEGSKECEEKVHIEYETGMLDTFIGLVGTDGETPLQKALVDS